jgi:hypothetical protein
LEAKYDAWLHASSISHSHEQPVKEVDGKCIADFVIEGEYVEIAGMIGFKKYQERWKRKCQLYNQRGVRWRAVYEDEVEKLFKNCGTAIIYVKRECSSCGVQLTVSFDGECRNCHRKTWGLRNSTPSICPQCNETFPLKAGAENGKFCSRKCYWESLRDDRLPDDSQLSKELEMNTGAELSRKYKVKATNIYMRMRRMKMRKAA